MINNELQLGAIPLSPDILGKANIGLWAFELDEGDAPRMYVDDTMLRLLGLEHQVSPEETYHAWYDHVDNESYPLVNEAVEKMMTEHAEVQYPWHHPDGRTIIVRCGGIRNPQYTKGVRIEGTHQDVTETLHYDDEKKKLEQIKKTMNMFFTLSNEYDPIIVVEPESGEYDWYMSMADDVTANTSMTVHGDCLYKNIGIDGASIIHEEDRAQFQAFYTPENMMKIAQTGETQEIENRWFIQTEGRYKWKYNKAVPMVDENGKALVVIGVIDTTEKKEKEAALELERQQAQQQLEKAYEEAKQANLRNDILLKIAKAGKWSYGINEKDEVISAQYADRAAQLLFGRTSEDPMSWLNVLHPEDRELVISNFLATIHDHTGNTPYDVTFRVFDTSGKLLWIQSSGRLIRHEDGTAEFYGVTINITEQILKEQAQHALSDGLAREYHTVWLVDGFGDHLLHLYRSTGKTTVKKAVELGLRVPSYDSAMTQYVKNSVHEDDRERVLEATKFETIVRETPDVGTYVVSYKRYNDEGTVDYHQMCFAKAMADDGTVNYILAYRDADKMLREQIEMQKQLKDAFDMAQSANQAKTLFLNNMSHDIRTPMNAIIGYTSMTQKYIDDKEKALDYLGKISKAGNNLLELINQVLDMSRIEAGTIILAEEPIDIIARGNEVTEIVESAAEAKNITLSTNTTNIKDRKVFADPGRMNQLMLNILGNAIKYTPEGGRIKHTITQSNCDKPGYATYVITTEDTGIGMSKEYLANIYEPFSREKTTTVSKIQGTGLGMAIVKRLVDLMGGTIDIESEPGKGTKITLTLSFKLQEKKKTGSSEQVIKPTVYTNVFKGKRTLLVEDNEMNREIAKMILEEHGLIVETAEDGDIAVAMMKELAEKKDWNHFDFVLMDVQMPTMDGYEATKAIRAIPAPEGVHIPIIAMTANAFAEDRQLALDAGMDEHIAKPLDVDQLWNTLAKFL